MRHNEKHQTKECFTVEQCFKCWKLRITCRTGHQTQWLRLELHPCKWFESSASVDVTNTPGPTDRQRERELTSRTFWSTTVWERTTTDFWVVLQTVTVDNTQMTKLIATRSRFLLECISIHLSVRDRVLIGGRYVVFWIFGGGWNQGVYECRWKNKCWGFPLLPQRLWWRRTRIGQTPNHPNTLPSSAGSCWWSCCRLTAATEAPHTWTSGVGTNVSELSVSCNTEKK